MAHGEICPVCKGSGKIVPVNNGVTTAVPQPKTCHGCYGKGWIIVPDSIMETKLITNPIKEGKSCTG